MERCVVVRTVADVWWISSLLHCHRNLRGSSW